jgi:hypothetical protein
LDFEGPVPNWKEMEPPREVGSHHRGYLHTAVPRGGVSIKEASEEGTATVNVLSHKDSLPTNLSNLEKGTDFLERISLRMTKMESTLPGEAKTVMATKSRTRHRNSMDWEGQMILDGFTGKAEDL